MFPSYYWISISLTRLLAKKKGGDEPNSELKIVDVEALSPKGPNFPNKAIHVDLTCRVKYRESRTSTHK